MTVEDTVWLACSDLTYLLCLSLSIVPQAGRGGRGRGGGRGGGSSGSGGQGIEAFFNPSMLENPWAALEHQMLPGRQQPVPARPAASGAPTLDAGSSEQGRLDPDGAADRPWH